MEENKLSILKVLLLPFIKKSQPLYLILLHSPNCGAFTIFLLILFLPHHCPWVEFLTLTLAFAVLILMPSFHTTGLRDCFPHSPYQLCSQLILISWLSLTESEQSKLKSDNCRWENLSSEYTQSIYGGINNVNLHAVKA